MSENGNGQSANGNGKAFVLAPPKSAEEIARDEIRKSMPRLRRECSRDPRLERCVGAKWLFGQLTDNSFLNDFGGDGWGKVYTSVKDLHRIYGHSEDAIAEWRDKLIQAGWIWFQVRWPKSCWGITAVCRQPELFAPHSDYVRVMARASAKDHPPETGGLSPTDQTADSGQNESGRRSDHPPLTVTPPATDGHSISHRRAHHPPLTGGVGGEKRSDHPPLPVTPPATDGQSNRSEPVTPPATDGHIEESPRSIGASGAFERGKAAPPTLEAWKRRLEKCFPPELEKLKADLLKEQKRIDDPADALMADISLRIEAIDEQLYGGKLPRKSAAPSKPVRVEPTQPKKPEDPALMEKLKKDLRTAAGMATP